MCVCVCDCMGSLFNLLIIHSFLFVSPLFLFAAANAATAAAGNSIQFNLIYILFDNLAIIADDSMDVVVVVLVLLNFLFRYQLILHFSVY